MIKVFKFHILPIYTSTTLCNEIIGMYASPKLQVICDQLPLILFSFLLDIFNSIARTHSAVYFRFDFFILTLYLL